MAYRISYLDSSQARQLVAVAETLDEGQAVARQVRTAVPQAANRLVIAEDPLLGVGFRVVQSPQNLDTAAGLSVVYLGGTIWSDSNWQARAIRILSEERCVIVNPRRERPPIDDNDLLDQLAWQRRHLWRCDVALFWFDGSASDPMGMLEFGTELGNPTPFAVGVSPDFPLRTALRANIGHFLPERSVPDTLDQTVAATIELIDTRARNLLRLAHHDDSLEASVVNIQLAIVRVKEGDPGIETRLRELVIEAGCAAGHGIEPHLITKIYVGVERLHRDPADPLGWTELLDVGHALEDY